jgi:receptor-type tyrosine-protein phosphatase Q/CUB/sushi domain-containing protein
MTTDGTVAFVIFIYAENGIQWTTGDASGGTDGLGGIPAHVGFNAGDGIRFESIPGSRTNEILNITITSNIGIDGVWVFRVDEEEIPMGGMCL